MCLRPEDHDHSAGAAGGTGPAGPVKLDTGVTQLALAWLLAQGDDIVPIPGTRNPARPAENVAAADVRLTDDDLTRVNDILPDGAFGSRYPAAMMPQW